MMKIIVVMFNGLVEEEKTRMIKIIDILLSINQNDLWQGGWYYKSTISKWSLKLFKIIYKHWEQIEIVTETVNNASRLKKTHI
jgi:hypothetical protein